MQAPVAFVTGASRGIGKACAIELAKVGYDVAISARTLTEGEAREHSSTVKQVRHPAAPRQPGHHRRSSSRPRDAKRSPWPPTSPTARTLTAAAATVLDEWGRVDVLVNNGRYIGPGHMDRLARHAPSNCSTTTSRPT